MKKILLVVFVLGSACILKAQEQDSTYKYWMTLGLMAYNNNGATLNLSYSFNIGHNFYKAGYSAKGDILHTSVPAKDGYQYQAVDVSIGKRWQSEWFQAALFAGPAYVFGKKRITYGNNEDYHTVGLNTDLQLLFRLANEVGIGVGLYGNVNFDHSYAGINVNFAIGNGK